MISRHAASHCGPLAYTRSHLHLLTKAFVLAARFGTRGSSLLTPFPTRDPDVGTVHAVGAVRRSPRPPPWVPGSARWLPGTVCSRLTKVLSAGKSVYTCFVMFCSPQDLSNQAPWTPSLWGLYRGRRDGPADLDLLGGDRGGKGDKRRCVTIRDGTDSEHSD